MSDSYHIWQGRDTGHIYVSPTEKGRRLEQIADLGFASGNTWIAANEVRRYMNAGAAFEDMASDLMLVLEDWHEDDHRTSALWRKVKAVRDELAAPQREESGE